jgi:hypothetical protein
MPMWGTCIDYDSIDHLCGRSGIHCGQEKPACHGVLRFQTQTRRCS